MSIPIIQIFKAICPLSEQAVADFSGIITFKNRPKGSHLLKIGHRAEAMFFIESGLARAYYEHKGREVTDYFAIDGQFIGAIPSLFTGQPSKKGIQLIVESVHGTSTLHHHRRWHCRTHGRHRTETHRHHRPRL